MMLSERLLNALNEQLTFEIASGHIYVAMAAYCAEQNLDGFTNFFIVQEQEERFHAMNFFSFINEMGGRAVLGGIEAPNNEFGSLAEVFEKALEHERLVTSRIYKLMDIAMEEKEYRTISFLNWFIDEQREEESTFSGLLDKVRRMESQGETLYQLDKELAARAFTPPAAE